MKNWNTVAIVGVGLIGGSIGLALRQRKLAREVVGISRRAATLRTAKARGAVTRTTTDIGSGVSNADLVVVCTPVETIVDQVRAVAAHVSPGTMITDAGSTKERIVTALDREFADPSREVAFIGSHPMAGSEKNGPRHARADLFENCVTIVTPTQASDRRAIREVTHFWRALGARVMQLAPDEHDAAVASISHLPHVVASALAAVTPASALPLAAGGWRDTTRIAAADPELWWQILSQNRVHVLKSLAEFNRQLAAFRQALEQNDRDAIEDLLAKGQAVRAAGQPRRKATRTRTHETI